MALNLKKLTKDVKWDTSRNRIMINWTKCGELDVFAATNRYSRLADLSRSGFHAISCLSGFYNGEVQRIVTWILQQQQHFI